MGEDAEAVTSGAGGGAIQGEFSHSFVVDKRKVKKVVLNEHELNLSLFDNTVRKPII